MVIYLHETKSQAVNYTSKLLKHLCNVNKIEISNDPNNCDVVFVSVCDITDIGILKKAKDSFSKPIVAGGFISPFRVLTAFADYVCVGDAYDFLRKLSTARHIEEVGEYEEVSTATKVGVMNRFIDRENTPCFQFRKQSYYYYIEKYCPQGCKFCLYGSLHRASSGAKHDMLVERALQLIPATARLFLMVGQPETNRIRYDLTKRLGILDVRIRKFINEQQWRFIGSRIRTGVEFLSEDVRRKFGKPISSAELRQFFHICREKGKTVVAYMIAGLESQDAAAQFIEDVVVFDNRGYPRILFNFTYIDFQPFTALADGNVRLKRRFNFLEFFKEAVGKNKRVRVAPAAYMALSTWRTLMSRCVTREEADFIYALRHKKDNELLIDAAEARYPHLIGTGDYRV